MSALLISAVAFLAVFGGTVTGLYIRTLIPREHLGPASRYVVNVSMGLTATMSALVLGLLVASAKESYDRKRDEIMSMAAKAIYLDRMLASYGPEAQNIRKLLGQVVNRALGRLRPDSSRSSADLKPLAAGAIDVYKSILALDPHSDEQRAVRSEALKICLDIGQERWMLYEQSGSFILIPFVVTLVCWIVIIFVSFGLFAPRNPVVLTLIFLSALSVSSAIFLILELDRPFQGLLHISGGPVLSTLKDIGH